MVFFHPAGATRYPTNVKFGTGKVRSPCQISRLSEYSTQNCKNFGKKSTGQNAIFDNRVRFLYPNFSVYIGEILLQFWILKHYFSFLQSYGCINTLCHILNSAGSIQQQLVICIVKKHWLLLQIQKSDK